MIFLEIDTLVGKNDFVYSFFYLLFLFFILIRYKWIYYKNENFSKYFVPAFAVKVVGCSFLVFMQQVIYKGGDTFVFFEGVTYINTAFSKSFDLGLEIVSKATEDFSSAAIAAMGNYFSSMPAGNMAVIRIGGVVSLFFNNLYFPIALTITLFSFLGSWRLYLFFLKFYPSLHKPLALACLFIPSTFLWGTGLQKDSICIGFLGFLTFASYKLLVEKKKIISNLFIIFISIYIILQIKTYIVLAYLPFLIILYATKFISLQKSKFIKYLIFVLLTIMVITLLPLINNYMQDNFSTFASDAIIENLVGTGNSISEQGKNDGGSAYSIGEIDPSLLGILKVIPGALVVSLYRPFVWEFRKVIDLPAILEALFTLIFTIKVFYKVGIKKFFSLLFKIPVVFYSFSFGVVFAIIAGISSGTFGTLSRYKIPGLPFYFVGLIIILYEAKNLKIAEKNKSLP